MPIITYAQALNEALREEMQRDDRVFLMGEDIGLHGGIFRVTKDLMDEFGPERVRDTPISESGFVGLGVGAAIAGMRPVVELLFMDFALVSADQIVNQAAKLRYMAGGSVSIPLVIRTQQGGGRGNGAQHSQSFDSWMAQVPGLIVIAPSMPLDAKGLLKSAIRCGNPVMFIEHKLLYNTKGEVPDQEFTLPIGKAEVKRPGRDITIVSYSRMKLLTNWRKSRLRQKSLICARSSRWTWKLSSNRFAAQAGCWLSMSRMRTAASERKLLHGYTNKPPTCSLSRRGAWEPNTFPSR